MFFWGVIYGIDSGMIIILK